MLDLQKTIKILLLAIVTLTFIVNFIYAFYPELYISYATGTSVESISNLVKVHDDIFAGKVGSEELKKICSALNSTLLATTYNKISSFLLYLNIILLAISIIFILKIQKIINKKYEYGLLFILFLSYFLFINQYTSNWNWFLYGCG